LFRVADVVPDVLVSINILKVSSVGTGRADKVDRERRAGPKGSPFFFDLLCDL
jgi:hypothetical protein